VLTSADLSGADLRNCRLQACLDGADLHHANIQGATFGELPSFVVGSWIRVVAVSPDGRFVYSGSSDKALKQCLVKNWMDVKREGSQAHGKTIPNHCLLAQLTRRGCPHLGRSRIHVDAAAHVGTRR
jgi:hypothetical protein